MSSTENNGVIVQLGVKSRVEGERGIPKRAVPDARLSFSGLEGDYNRYRTERKQGDPGMAVLLMTREKLAQINREGWPVEPGDLGENILIEGIPYGSLTPGTRVRAGEAELEIFQACAPCTNLQVLPYVGPEKINAFIKSLLNRRGWYARVVTPGILKVGDGVEVAA